MLKKIIVFFFVLQIAISCYSQRSEKVAVKTVIKEIGFEIYSIAFGKYEPNMNCLRAKLTLLELKEFILTDEQYARTDFSVNYELYMKGGVCWEVSKPPIRPKWPLFKRSDIETHTWYSYQAFRKECEHQSISAFELVDFVIAEVNYNRSDEQVCPSRTIYLRPNKEGKLELVDPPVVLSVPATD